MRLGRDRKKKQEKGKEKKVKGILRKMENSKGTRFCALTIFWDVAEKGGGFEIIKGEREKGNKKRKKGKLGIASLFFCFSRRPAEGEAPHSAGRWYVFCYSDYRLWLMITGLWLTGRHIWIII